MAAVGGVSKLTFRLICETSLDMMIVLCDYKMLSVVREFQVDGGGGYYIRYKHKIVHAAADVNTTKR